MQIGGNGAGLRDGSPAEAAFFAPQGLAYCRRLNVLYVADTENHALREVRGGLPLDSPPLLLVGAVASRGVGSVSPTLNPAVFSSRCGGTAWPSTCMVAQQACTLSAFPNLCLCKLSLPAGFLAASRFLRVNAANAASLQVDLTSGRVRTLAGNGFKGSDYVGGRAGREQQLNSPWDVVLDTQVKLCASRWLLLPDQKDPESS